MTINMEEVKKLDEKGKIWLGNLLRQISKEHPEDITEEDKKKIEEIMSRELDGTLTALTEVMSIENLEQLSEKERQNIKESLNRLIQKIDKSIERFN